MGSGHEKEKWQKTAVFPDWKGYVDDTLAMNCMLSFQFFHGQGSIFLKAAKGVTRFSLYVNGTAFDTAPMTGDGASGKNVCEVDISGAAVDGINTLQISGIFPQEPEYTVEVWIPYPEVLESDRGLEGIRPEALRFIEAIISSDIKRGFPGAQLSVVRNGRLVYENAWGSVCRYRQDGTCMEDPVPVTTRTLFDLASVTKMAAANYAIQKLVTEGKLETDRKITDLLGEAFAEDTLDLAFSGAAPKPDLPQQVSWKRFITVKDLLRHQAGFPVSPHYNDPDYDMALQKKGRAGANRCYAKNRRETYEAICKTPLLYAPGTHTAYSDVDYLLLTFVIEKVTGKRLDVYMKETFFDPMGLEHITFLPLENGFLPDDCAATELNGNTRDGRVYFDGIRTGTLQGQVHDERAWHCMEGVSGHAGLFSSASDLARLGSVMLTGGYGQNRFFSRAVLDLFTAPKSIALEQWGLGWFRQGDDGRVWYFGTQAGPDTVGHQGWTGTLLMIDPSRNLVIAYLTNKLNTPAAEGDDPSRFTGNAFTTSTLGFVPQILSVGMDSDTDISGQLADLEREMEAEKQKLCMRENHLRT